MLWSDSHSCLLIAAGHTSSCSVATSVALYIVELFQQKILQQISDVMHIPSDLRSKALITEIQLRIMSLSFHASVDGVMNSIESATSAGLMSLARLHGVSHHPSYDKETLRNVVFRHITSGNCLSRATSCCRTLSDILQANDCRFRDEHDWFMQMLSMASKKFSKKTLQRVLQFSEIDFEEGASVRQLRRLAKNRCSQFKKLDQKKRTRERVFAMRTDKREAQK